MPIHQTVLEKVRASKQDGPCVSIYLRKPDVHRSQDLPSVQLFQELMYARRLLETSMPRSSAADYLRPLWKAARMGLGKENAGTIALFQSGESALCIPLAKDASPSTVVARDFHVKPLCKQQQLRKAGPLERALTVCRRSMNEGRALTGLYSIAQALKEGKAHCLWVAEDVTLWGVLNRKRGTIVLHPKQMNDRDADVLDDLLEWAIDQGSEAYVLPRHQIPGQHPVIAEI